MLENQNEDAPPRGIPLKTEFQLQFPEALSMT